MIDGFKIYNMDMGDDVPILIERHTANSMQNFDMDIHLDLELGIVLTGAMDRIHLDSNLSLLPGDIWFCNAWMPHGHMVADQCERMVLMIKPYFLSNLCFAEAPDLSWTAPFFNWGDRKLELTDAEREINLEFAKKILGNSNTSKFDRLRTHFAFLDFFLPYVMKANAKRNMPLDSNNSYQRIIPALRALFTSGKLLSNNDAAELCGMSRDQFIRTFQATIGMTFCKFSLNFRLKCAAKEILSSELKLKEIADKWDFSNESHLIRLFVKNYGCTPIEYRKEKQSSQDAGIPKRFA